MIGYDSYGSRLYPLLLKEENGLGTHLIRQLPTAEETNVINPLRKGKAYPHTLKVESNSRSYYEFRNMYRQPPSLRQGLIGLWWEMIWDQHKDS